MRSIVRLNSSLLATLEDKIGQSLILMERHASKRRRLWTSKDAIDVAAGLTATIIKSIPCKKHGQNKTKRRRHFELARVHSARFRLIIPPNLRNLLRESSNLRKAPSVTISFAGTKKTKKKEKKKEKEKEEEEEAGLGRSESIGEAAASAIKVRYLASPDRLFHSSIAPVGT